MNISKKSLKLTKNRFKYVLFFICLSVIISSCAKKKEVDTMALLKEELNVSISEIRTRNFEIFTKIEQRAKLNKTMDSVYRGTGIDSFKFNMEIKRNTIINANSNLELLTACRNNELKFHQSHHFEDLSSELRTEDLELNRLYKLQTLEKMYQRAIELVSYLQELEEVKCP